MTTLLYKPAFTGAWQGCRASSFSQRCPTQGKKHSPSSHASSGTSSCSPLSLPRSLVQQERKHLTKKSDLHWCLRWSPRQSICCVRALHIKAQLLHKANTAATCSPEPSGTSRPALATGPHPTAASTPRSGKAKTFSFPHSCKPRRSHLPYSSKARRISMCSSLAVSYYAPYSFYFAARVAYVEIRNANKGRNEEVV